MPDFEFPSPGWMARSPTAQPLVRLDDEGDEDEEDDKDDEDEEDEGDDDDDGEGDDKTLEVRMFNGRGTYCVLSRSIGLDS